MFENRIDMTGIGSRKEKPQVLYFYMRAVDEESVTQRIARLALFSVLTAINHVPEQDKRRTYVFIDEFQVLALDVLARLFEQAAGLKVSYILSNQSLHTLPRQLQETLAENTAFRQIFRAGSNMARRYIRDRSGETIYQSLQRNGELAEGSEPLGDDPKFHPYYRDAQIVAGSYDPHTSWIEMSSPKGLAQYGGNLFELLSDYHIPKREYKRRLHQEWPAKCSRTLVAAENRDLLQKHSTSPQAAVDAIAPEIRALIPERTRERAPDNASDQQTMLPLRPVREMPEFDRNVQAFREGFEALTRAIESGKPFPLRSTLKGVNSDETRESR